MQFAQPPFFERSGAGDATRKKYDTRRCEHKRVGTWSKYTEYLKEIAQHNDNKRLVSGAAKVTAVYLLEQRSTMTLGFGMRAPVAPPGPPPPPPPGGG